MKLQFPNGEHAAVDLKLGANKVGSATGNEVLLMAPGIAFDWPVALRNAAPTSAR